MTELLNSREVVPGLVYRSAAPYGLDAEDVHTVVNALALGAVADLRGPRERVLVPWLGLESAGVELLDVAMVASADDAALALQTPQDLGELYLDWLDLKRETVVRALSPLASGTPLLLHCAAGKDRTGVLAALVGLLAGHERERIVADYTATAANMGQVKAAMLQAYREVVPSETLAHLAEENAPIIMSAPAEAMEVFLDGVEQHYGGVGGFLNSTHLHPGVAAALRGRLREVQG
ncbi:tyrosine-protein phosphatase [Galactobacter caseinivorans]|uniref:Protein-tyrosine-phosphatase n=1 Tax=Galactobacter caseinivorans TaxID=2676123 RepID=A0A496PFN1_9MICC|nr:tyrosine-protein phosphatase [Galactobacter caseinivorans]RKW69547.1 protein-tyrosine-phosphatase [Galactobacter caseinivorans]